MYTHTANIARQNPASDGVATITNSDPHAAGASFLGGMTGKTKMTYQLYEAEKSIWLRKHPDATPAQILRAFQAIARRLGL